MEAPSQKLLLLVMDRMVITGDLLSHWFNELNARVQKTFSEFSVKGIAKSYMQKLEERSIRMTHNESIPFPFFTIYSELWEHLGFLRRIQRFNRNQLIHLLERMPISWRHGGC